MGDEKRLTRSLRLTQMQGILFGNLRGFTTRELSRLFAVSQRTIQRDLCSLQDMGVPLTQHGDRYGILHTYMLPPITFSLQEAMAIFLGSRLILRQTDENNPHIESALKKVANALPQKIAEKLRHSIQALGTKIANPEHVAIFEKVAIAWATQRRLRIRYQSLHRTETREWLLDPYSVEMTSVGYSAYVIGYARHQQRQGLTTFKLDRIKDAELLDETFEIPPGFDLDKLLGSSWGIIWDENTIEVKLRFTPDVVRRVKETVWHPSQRVEDLADGGCLMTLRVSNTLEMVPWIRSWGPDVEVLEPLELRHSFANYAMKLAQVYSSGTRP